MKNYLLRGFSVLGILLFVPLFFFTFSDPQTVEKSGKSFIEWKLKNDVNEKIDSIQWPQSQTLEKFLGSKAKELNKIADAKLSKYKQMLKDDVPALIAKQLAIVHNLDCECRKKWEERLTSFVKFEITTLEKAKVKLTDFMQAKYMEIVEKLTMDVRIFLGINSFVFIFLFMVSFLKPKATVPLFIPGILLFLSTAISIYFYLFEQNWFYTILYSDYVGFGYLAYILLVFSILSDILFNKALVTTGIIALVMNAIASVFSAASC